MTPAVASGAIPRAFRLTLAAIALSLLPCAGPAAAAVQDAGARPDATPAPAPGQGPGNLVDGADGDSDTSAAAGAAAAGAAAGTPDSADSDGAAARPEALAGRVVHGVGGDGVSGVPVELHRVRTDGGAVIDSAVTADDGSFRFALSDEASRPVFLVAARHDGVRYFGPAIHAGRELAGPYEVAVYDTLVVTEPPEDLRVGVRHVVVTRAPEGSGLDVAEVIDVIGPEDRTLVPGSASPGLWSTALPDDVREPGVLDSGASAGVVAFEDGRAVLRSMIPPAGARVGYTYRVEGDRLRLSIEHPVDRVQLVVAGAGADVEGAAHVETTTREGRLVYRYEGTALEAGDALEVRLVEPRRGVDRWVWIWAGAGALLLLAAGVLWWTGPRASAG